MTLKTWKAEFYKIEPKKNMTKIGAISHSILKWEGLKKKNLKKHGLAFTEDYDVIDIDGNLFEPNADSCALCIKYSIDEYSVDDYGRPLIPESEHSRCAKCPLYKSLGDTPCWGYGSPWGEWLDNSSALPMIRALTRCLKENS